MDRTTKIKVKRRANYMGFLRAFKIYVDGKKVAAVGNGQEVDFEIEPGRHCIDILGSIWAKSQVLDIGAQPGETLVFECGIESKFMYPFFVAIFISFLSRAVLPMIPGGRIISFVLVLALFVYSIVFTVMTFQRGTVYYLKQVGPGRD
jgi:hypothetical protein